MSKDFYHQITLAQAYARTLPLNVEQRDMTLYQTYAAANDILMRQMALAPVWPLALITLRPIPDPAEVFGYVPGVYPSPYDVDKTAVKYGPTGIEYQGTLLQPLVADVKSGVKYGGDGTEFTGTLAGGSGLTPGTILIDPSTGQRYIYLSDKLIVNVG